MIVLRQVLNLEVLSVETELARSDEELPADKDLESGSLTSIWWDTQSIEWEIKRPIQKEDMLLKSEAHLTLVKACTQRLLGNYNRLDSDLRYLNSAWRLARLVVI